MATETWSARAAPSRSAGVPAFARRWAWIAVPMLAIVTLEALQDTALGGLLPVPVHLLVLAAALFGGAAIVARTLFRRFDQLALELQGQNEELRARSNAMAALQQVSLAVSSLSDIDRVLDTATDQARRLLSGDVAVLCLAGDDGVLAPRSRSGPAEAFHLGPDTCPHPAGRGGACPLLTGTTSGNHGELVAAPLCQYIDPSFLGSSVAVPLLAGNRLLGSLAIATRARREFRALELSTLESLAANAAVAIENARLYARVRELGILEERTRIARELHDGLAQVLGYVGTKSEAAISLLDAGRSADARTQLADLGEAARSVYVDVREAILGLSSPVAPEPGVLAAIRSYAERYEDFAKLPTLVRVEDGVDDISLAPAAEAQALRLLQEALTNVRKHAQARRVTIAARLEDAAFVLEVIDDGRGFDPGASGGSDWPHFGLATMRERASSVGGRVEIDSRPGAGTRVQFRLPVAGSGQ